MSPKLSRNTTDNEPFIAVMRECQEPEQDAADDKALRVQPYHSKVDDNSGMRTPFYGAN